MPSNLSPTHIKTEVTLNIQVDLLPNGLSPTQRLAAIVLGAVLFYMTFDLIRIRNPFPAAVSAIFGILLLCAGVRKVKG